MLVDYFVDSSYPAQCRRCGAAVVWVELLSKDGTMSAFSGVLVEIKPANLFADGARPVATLDTRINPIHAATCPALRRRRT